MREVGQKEFLCPGVPTTVARSTIPEFETVLSCGRPGDKYPCAGKNSLMCGENGKTTANSQTVAG